MKVAQLIAALSCALFWPKIAAADEKPKSFLERTTDILQKACRAADPPQQYAVSTKIESEQEVGGRWAVGVRLEVAISGRVRPELTFGSVGVDESREKALEAAVYEWFQLFVDPYCEAMSRAPGIAHGSMIVHASVTGFRGAAPGGWLASDAQMHNKLLGALDFTPSGELSTLDIKVAQRGAWTECRLNGTPSPKLCAKLAKLDWPAGDYLVKQYYVLRPKTP